jgi:CRP-like cAMP-binding protein
MKVETSPLLWIQGSRAVAVRFPDGDRHRLIPWSKDEPFTPTPGIYLSLEEGREGPLGPDEVPTARRGFYPLSFPLSSPWIKLLGIIPFALMATHFVAGGWSFRATFSVPVLSGIGELLFYLLGVFVAFWVQHLIAGATLRGELRGNAPVYGFRYGFPWVEPCGWRVGVSSETAYLPLLFGIGLYLYTGGVSHPFFSGVQLGTAFFLLHSLFPLRPGPGARLLEDLSGIPDILPHLELNLIARFLPIPSPVRSGGSERMGLVALVVVAWFFLCGIILKELSLPSEGVGLYDLFLRLGGTAGIVLLGLWGGVYAFQLIALAVRISRRNEIRPFTPPPSLQDRWLDESALFYHVKGLKELPLRWYEYPPGAFLIHYGDTDRRFYWIVEGLVEILGRSPLGDPVVLARLGGGCGVGEIAFLEAKPRTADVVVLKPTIVVEVSYEDFAERIPEEGVERFREVVLASQSLSRSGLFRSIPPHHRERWIRYGEPRRFSPGETIIREGEMERWMGIVVRGEVEVRKGEELKAILSQDDIFGEIAFLYRVPRTATLTARTPVLIWRWEGEWLEEEAQRRGLIPAFEAIARSRL